MEKALNIPEIRLLVCEAATKATLTALARVSKSFSGFALDSMYHEVRLDQVLRVLPSELWKVEWQGAYDPIELIHPLVAEHWLGRFTLYASRVNTLVIDFYHTSLWVLYVIARSCPTSPLFPSLRRLEVRDAITLPFWTIMSAHLHVLLSPSLHSLSLESTTELEDAADWELKYLERQEATFIRTVPRFSPHLRNIEILGYATKGHVPVAFGYAFERWKSMQTVCFSNCTILSVEGVQALSQLEELTTLHVAVHKLPNLPSFSGFPSLRQLFLTADDLNCSSLIRTVSSKVLRHFEWSCPFHLGPNLPTQDTRPYLPVLVHVSFPRAIEILAVDLTDPVVAVSADTLQILHNFSNLEELRLNVHAGFNIKDDDIRNLVESIPRLKQMTLTGDPFGRPPPDGHQPGITLGALLSVAQHLPKLRNLTLPINTSHPIQIPTIPVGMTFVSKLEYLSIGGRPPRPEPVAPVAFYLATLFPVLKSVEGTQFGDRTWKSVNDMIPYLFMSRDAEALEVRRAMQTN
ncbi:hypothetical protein DL96DRAFT_244991 [Flagelloscypha sp. PMI_526]|nr:hypothetical protein DL96DRAFT_244991 [Flagelloscypha sp. PMI_526]